MTMVWLTKPAPASSSTLTRYKRSGLQVPGTAVRVAARQEDRRSVAKTASSSAKSSAASSTGSSSSTSSLKKSKSKSKIRPLKSRIRTVRHNLGAGGQQEYAVTWVRTRAGAYIRQRREAEPSFREKYELGAELGKGGFGTVYAGVRVKDGASVAIKHVSRARVIAWDTWRGYKVPQELRLLMEVQHVAGVVKMIDFYEREDSFIYVMEKPPNYLDMFDYITQQKRLTETAARDFFRQVVATVAACSRSKIVHRDIKDENLLVNLDTMQLTLIDFGSGGLIKQGHYTEFDGTRVYSPPEWVCHQRYRWEGLTVWSLGILLYDMVAGDIPWQEDEEIAAARLRFPAGLSPEVRSLIRGCLQLDVAARLTLAEVEAHPWLLASQL